MVTYGTSKEFPAFFTAKSGCYVSLFTYYMYMYVDYMVYMYMIDMYVHIIG